MKRSTFSVPATIMLLLAHASIFADDYELNWFTIDGGGAMNSAGGSFEVFGTIGQPDAQVQPAMSGGTFEVTGGFWPAANICFCLSDMNADGKRNGDDVQQFVTCLIAGGDCHCADADQANGVTLADVGVFVADLLGNDSCP